MSSRYGSNTDEHWLRQGSPSGIRNQSIGLLDIDADLAAALTTQVMTCVAVPCQVGDLITNVSFTSGATAAGTPTNYWFALYDPSLNLLAQTADQLTAAWAASTPKKLPLTTAQRCTTSGIYYAAVMVKATTVPSLIGKNVVLAVAAGGLDGSKVLAQTSGSALVGTAPATIATPTTVATLPLAILT